MSKQIITCGPLLSNYGQFKIVDKANWDGNWKDRYYPNRKEKDEVFAFSYDGEIEGIPYAETGFCSMGVSFTFFVPVGTSKDRVSKARNQLMNDRDVVRIDIYQEEIE